MIDIKKIAFTATILLLEFNNLHGQLIPGLQKRNTASLQAQQEKNKKEEEAQFNKRLFGGQTRDTYIDQIRNGRSMTNLFSSELILAEPIDPDSYIVGPGDALLVNLWGGFELELQTQVLPDGYVFIPSVGSHRVIGLSLTETRNLLKNVVKKKYRDTNSNLHLLSAKRFRVYVTGEVKKPGTYFAQSSDRLSDILELAGGPTNWADMLRVKIKHDDKEESADLRKFYGAGDLSENPNMKSGLVVQVQPISMDNPHVIVENEQQLHTTFPIYENESLVHFLHTAKLLTNESSLENITIKRGKSLIGVDLANPKRDSVILQSGDRIYLAKIIDRVYVDGAVHIPGAQFYFPGLKAIDYAGSAGITALAGAPKRIKVKRAIDGSILKGPNTIVHRGDVVLVPRSFTVRGLEILEALGDIAYIVVSVWTLRDLANK